MSFFFLVTHTTANISYPPPYSIGIFQPPPPSENSCLSEVASLAYSIYYSLQAEGRITSITFSEQNYDEVISYTTGLTETIASALALKETQSCVQNDMLPLIVQQLTIYKSRKLTSLRCSADVDLSAERYGEIFGLYSDLINSKACEALAAQAVTELGIALISLAIAQPEFIPIISTLGQPAMIVTGVVVQKYCGDILENVENLAIKTLNNLMNTGESDVTRESFNCGIRIGNIAGSLVDLAQSFGEIQNVIKEIGGGKALLNGIVATSKNPTLWSNLVNKVLKSISTGFVNTYSTVTEFCNEENKNCIAICGCESPPPSPPPPPPPPPPPSPCTAIAQVYNPDPMHDDCDYVSTYGLNEACCDYGSKEFGQICGGDLSLPLCPKGKVIVKNVDGTQLQNGPFPTGKYLLSSRKLFFKYI